MINTLTYDKPPQNDIALKVDYEEFLESLNLPGITRHQLLDSAGGLPIYGYSVGDLVNKNCIMIDGCYHKRHEYRSSYWIAEFIKFLADPPDKFKTIVNHLKTYYSFYFVPVVSPDAYTNYLGDLSGGNANRVDIGRNFDFNWDGTPYYVGPNSNPQSRVKGDYPFSETESQNIKNIIENIKPIAYVNCHAWGDYTGYTFLSPQNSKYQVLTESMYKNIKFLTKLRNGTNVELGGKQPFATSFNWVGEQYSKNGEKIISNIYEVGTVESSESQYILGVNGLFNICLHIDNYMKNRELVANKHV